SDRLVLSRRRSMRRLRWANCRCNLVFTRNPFLLVVDGVWLHHQTPQNPKDFEFLQNPPSPPHGEFAWLRTKQKSGTATAARFSSLHAADAFCTTTPRPAPTRNRCGARRMRWVWNSGRTDQ